MSCALSTTCTVPPLFVIEFLHRIMDVFAEYFGECSEAKIKDHYVTVYEVHRVSYRILSLGGGETPMLRVCAH